MIEASDTREVVLDLETTGFDFKGKDRIIEIGVVELVNNEATGKEFRRLVKPGSMRIPREITQLTGITNEDVKDEKKFKHPSVMSELLEFIGDSNIIAHNASFDRNFLNAALSRAGAQELPEERWIDTLRLAKEKLNLRYNKLDDLCDHFGISGESREKHHGALIDARLTADVYIELMGSTAPNKRKNKEKKPKILINPMIKDSDTREVALGLQTTGCDFTGRDRIIEIGIVELVNNKAIGEKFRRLVNPENIRIPAHITQLTGLTDKDVDDERKFEHPSVMSELLEFIGDSNIIAHTSFYRNFLNAALSRAGTQELPKERWIDTRRLAEEKLNLRSNTRDALSEHFGISRKSREKHHGALIDARLTADVYIELMGSTAPNKRQNKERKPKMSKDQKMKLVVVESPAKAKTINKYLGDSYKVLASYGHIRDLPSKEGVVDPGKDFKMDWGISSDARRHIKEISDAAKQSEKLILATDPDREGEAISWHIHEILKNNRTLKNDCVVERVVFNAITKSAVTKAMDEPRQINQGLVDAYLARRALDYLVGFTLSPVLWRKLPGSRSAGRVQSVALRVVCEREHEIEVFIPQEYWQVQANLRAPCGTNFEAKLYALDGKVLKKFTLDNKETADSALEAVKAGGYSVQNVESKPFKRRPAPPFITSTLQQEASRKLGFNAKRTMKAAQLLYEDGKITYMRTDGVSMAEEAYKSVRQQIESNYGKNYLPETTIRYTSKQKNAQEAHEAIRPTSFRLDPKELGVKDKDAFILYGLIWKRAVASQMLPALYERTTADIVSRDERAVLRATGQVLIFDGFTRVYTEGRDKDESSEEDNDQDRKLPKLNVGDSTDLVDADNSQHHTKPPPRYTEASLVKKLEELGIGRPSTYAETMSKLVDREYVRNEEKQLRPENKGRVVTAFLENFFRQYVEYDFTANLEDKLDTISDGKLNWKSFLKGFWDDFKTIVDASMELRMTDVINRLDKDLSDHFFPTHDQDGNPTENPRKCPKCGSGRLGLKLSKNGGFFGCSKYPECTYTRNMTPVSGDGSVLDENRCLGQHPEAKQEVFIKTGRYGPYVEMKVPNAEKPKRMNIPKEWGLDTLSLEQAVNLLGLPKIIGEHPDDKEPIKASLGRYGPYVQHQKTFANLESVNDLFEIGLNRAVSLIADKRSNQFTRGQRNVEVLNDLGPHPETKEPLQVLNGRYGPYVKSGKINASLPKDMEPGDVSVDFAVDLIAKRAANPVKRGRGKTARRSTTRQTSKK